MRHRFLAGFARIHHRDTETTRAVQAGLAEEGRNAGTYRPFLFLIPALLIEHFFP